MCFVQQLDINRPQILDRHRTPRRSILYQRMHRAIMKEGNSYINLVLVPF